MGYGPYRVWKNRMKGNSFGSWHKKYESYKKGKDDIDQYIANKFNIEIDKEDINKE